MQNYHEQENFKNIEKMRELRKELPPFLGEFFRGKADYTSTKTRLAYAYDLRLFFNFLINETLEFKNKNIRELKLDDLDLVTVEHIEEFMEYLSYYVKVSKSIKGERIETKVQNKIEGKNRKLSTVKTMFTYFNKKDKIKVNPAVPVVSAPKKEKEKIYLEVHEIANLLDKVENGSNLTDTQKRYHAYTKSRDLALLSLFAGTGIRISEAVGINMDDIMLDENSFRITRKGGDVAILYFNDEIKEALAQYIVERKKAIPKKGHEDALFLSMQNKRITQRSVQLLVKKYTSDLTLKNITPHKFRTGFGTNVYHQTGDIYLVGSLLGHKDINTTTKHYAAANDEKARKTVLEYKLREE